MDIFCGYSSINSRLYLDFYKDTITLYDSYTDNYIELDEEEINFIMYWCFHKHSLRRGYTYENIDNDFIYYIDLWDKGDN